MKPLPSTPETIKPQAAPETPVDAQPLKENGVEEEMGTLALHPRLMDSSYPAAPAGRVTSTVELTEERLAVRAQAVARGDFAELSDAEVMLELRAGNMAAFDVLLAKYRRPIISFMYRMVRNQAVAEELAQEVFLRVFRSAKPIALRLASAPGCTALRPI